ncbi:acyltransferase family protein [Nocardioides currus]|uniref:Acyltransferase 3 domain-containing protein n=1 Tax=Nocardioides currus TaxID=2133958 RepID=A0A2R7Z378_9ACTN|nr:acyltransferase [Nocardioides currus]PUA83014.1 hypothetical protein C7S10_04870 [Nocardioides currus]
MPSSYIRGFDALRGVSILLVMSMHLGITTAVLGESSPALDLVSGSAGVNVFFVLSGYLITSLLLRERTRTGRISLRGFYLRRVLRLAPPLVVLYTAVLGLMLAGALPRDILGLGMSVAWLYNFVPWTHYQPELAHTWSLAVEEQFYALWPAVVVFLGTRVRWLQAVCAAVIGCCLAVPALWTVGLQGSFAVERFFIPGCLPIMVGCATALLMTSSQAIAVVDRLGWRLVAPAGLLYVARLAVGDPPPGIVSATQAVSVAVLLAVIVRRQDSAITRALEIAPLRWLGRISYGLYVYQGLFLRNGPGGELWFQQPGANIVLTFAVAIASYVLLERPVLRLKDKWRTDGRRAFAITPGA